MVEKNKKKIQEILTVSLIYFVFVVISGGVLYLIHLRPYNLSKIRPLVVDKNEVSTEESDPRASDLFIFREYPVYGIDVSKHNGRIKWKDIPIASEGKRGISFVFIKATEGYRFKDYRYSYNYREAQKRNIKVGAYHFYSPNKEPELQAENFIKQAHLKQGDLLPVLDVESRGELPIVEFRKNLLLFLKTLEENYGVKPLLYTYTSFYHDYLNHASFKSYPKWIARYNIKSPVRKRHDWQFWQYSQTGRINGIKSDVDLNVFWGNKAELEIYTIH